MMKVLLYADFRSPHAQGWKAGLIASGIDVVAVSSETVDSDEVIGPRSRLSELRQRFVNAGGGKVGGRMIRSLASVQLFHSLVQLARGRGRRREILDAVLKERPDLIHALRLPYEGVTVLSMRTSVPRIVSSWGQDFLPQAKTDPLLRHWLRRYMRTVDGFQFDASQDLERARKFGLRKEAPVMHAAGNFGVDESIFYPPVAKRPGLVVYARKVTPNCNYMGFLEAAMQLVPSTDAVFVGVGLAHLKGEVTRRWGDVDERRVQLLGELSREDFAALLRSAEVVVSPAYTDGMPNSVLEALACGARVVAGDLPQLRELANGSSVVDLIDARSSGSIASGIERQLGQEANERTPLPDAYSRERNTDAVRTFYSAVLAATVN
jgi:glycosyltransferase involved in cell wall biosynthesis